jgi:hypothetical protein
MSMVAVLTRKKIFHRPTSSNEMMPKKSLCDISFVQNELKVNVTKLWALNIVILTLFGAALSFMDSVR